MLAMEIFGPVDDAGMVRIEALYRRAREAGHQWVTYLDVCFDGGDAVEDAEKLLGERMGDNVSVDKFFPDDETG